MVVNGDSDGPETIVVSMPDNEQVSVEVTKPFVETLTCLARAKGLQKIDVYVDGDKIDIADAPMNFEGLDSVRFEKYDEGS